MGRDENPAARLWKLSRQPLFLAFFHDQNELVFAQDLASDLAPSMRFQIEAFPDGDTRRGFGHTPPFHGTNAGRTDSNAGKVPLDQPFSQRAAADIAGAYTQNAVDAHKN
jgi:hypothetical protein